MNNPLQQTVAKHPPPPPPPAPASTITPAGPPAQKGNSQIQNYFQHQQTQSMEVEAMQKSFPFLPNQNQGQLQSSWNHVAPPPQPSGGTTSTSTSTSESGVSSNVRFQNPPDLAMLQAIMLEKDAEIFRLKSENKEATAKATTLGAENNHLKRTITRRVSSLKICHERDASAKENEARKIFNHFKSVLMIPSDVYSNLDNVTQQLQQTQEKLNDYRTNYDKMREEHDTVVNLLHSRDKEIAKIQAAQWHLQQENKDKKDEVFRLHVELAKLRGQNEIQMQSKVDAYDAYRVKANALEFLLAKERAEKNALLRRLHFRSPANFNSSDSDCHSLTEGEGDCEDVSVSPRPITGTKRGPADNSVVAFSPTKRWRQQYKSD